MKKLLEGSSFGFVGRVMDKMIAKAYCQKTRKKKFVIAREVILKI